MNAGYKKAMSRVLVAVLSLLMVFGNVATPFSGVFSVYAQDEEQQVEATETTEDVTNEGEQNQDETVGNTEEIDDSSDVADDKGTEEGGTNEEGSGDENAVNPEDRAAGDNIVTPEETPGKENLSEFAGAVYVDGVNGDDAKDGFSKENAVKSWEKAVEIIGSNAGTIYVCNTVTVSGTVQTNDPANQTVKRAEDFNGDIFKVSDNAEFKDIHVDGESKAANGTGVAMLDCSGGSLEFGENAVFENLVGGKAHSFEYRNKNWNINTTGGGAAAVINCENATIKVVDGAVFKNNKSNGSGGAIYIGSSHNATVTVNESIFEGNISNGAKNEAGGAICIWGSDDVRLKVGDAEFTDNRSNGLGGAIGFEKKSAANFVSKGILEIKGAKFTGNTAGNEGGAIFLSGDYDTTIYSGRFEGNSAYKASVIKNGNHTTENKITIYGALITKNDTVKDAGAVTICEFAGTEVTVSADVSNGAAIFNNTGELGDLGVFEGSSRSKIKVNEGTMLGGGNHNWTEVGDRGYKAAPTGNKTANDLISSGLATTVIKDNHSKGEGAIQSNGIVTFGKARATLRIRKVDSKNSNLPLDNASFELVGTTVDGETIDRITESFIEYKKNGEIKSYVENGMASFKDIPDGTYTLKEVKAPAGYQKLNTSWTVKVSGGNVEMYDANGNIIDKIAGLYDYYIENEKSNIRISKTDLNGTEVAGAEIVVKDDAGKVVDRWTSGSEPHKISGITTGDYTMTEVVAPVGYEPVKTVIDFHVDVDKDGYATVTTTEVKENGNVVNEVDANGVLVLKDDTYKAPEAEKYVNKDVTWDFDNFDQVFEYEIMAYVPYDATKFTISDELVSALEFANGGNVQLFDMGDGYNVNDHNVNGTVAKAGNKINPTSATASGQKLEVKVDDAASLQRHWVKVTFNAQIKESAYEDVKSYLAAKAAGNAADNANWAKEISNNGLVLTQTKHDGIPNKAKYEVETANNGDFDSETNTVTVEPKTVELKVKKSWKNILWPTNTKVTFAVYKHKAGEADEEVTQLVLDSKETAKTITLPRLEGVTYSAKEINVNKNGVDSKVNASGNFVIGAINYIANIVKDLFAGSTDGEHETQNELNVEVKINKTDLGGNELDGAEIVVYDKNGNKVKNWISKKGETFDLLLEPGDYTFEEVVAPEGYHKVTTKIGFTVDEDGKVTVNTTTVDPLGAVKLDANNTIVLSDAPIQKPEDEKYVNNDVTADLDNFDDTFEYEIMAYVTNDGKALTITDELVPALEFVGDGNVKVYDMGSKNDHATTVAKAGKALESSAYTAETSGQKLEVKIADAAPYREHWIKVTFDAQISQKAYDEVAALIAEKAENGTAEDKAKAWENVKDNLKVQIKKSHDGVPNKAKYTLETINRGDFTEETNTVTVEPKTTEVKVSKVWQKDDKNITWPKGATVQVKLQAQKGSEAAEDVAGATATLSEQAKSHVFKNLPMLDGVKYSVVEVKAANADEFTLGSAVETKAGEWTITNKTYTPEIEKFVNEAVHKDVDLSEVFTYDVVAYVTPDADKVVVYDELNDDLQFVSKAGDVKVADLGKANNHDVTNNVKAEKVNSKATVAESGTAIDAKVSIDGQLLKVVIADAKAYRGNWIKVTFNAKIADGKKLAELKYTEISAKDAEDRAEPNVGNAPVNSKENHTGIPNKAKYDIFVSNNASAESGSDSNPGENPDDNPKVEEPEKPRYNDESNTVTVKPEEYSVKISKTDFGGTELPGAEIKVTGPAGFESTWTSTTEAKELKLVAGEYKMTEVNAPEGFIKVTTVIEFKVDEEGKVTVTSTEVEPVGAVKVDGENHLILTDTAFEEPKIEKYVNKKTSDLADKERDGTVHTDLSAFDEVYTYDIQAYITPDATVVEVNDELQSVLEFAGDAPTAVVVKDGEGASGAVAPKLTKAGEAPAYEYSVDAEAWKAGRLVLTMGSDAKDAKALYPNGKWLQITFDAKIKDAYKSMEALDKAGADVWTEITENGPIDDADVVEAFSGAETGSHSGIVNDASYNVKSIVAGLNVDNEWAYSVKSNTVTVQPNFTEVFFSKTDLDGEELPGAKMVLTDMDGNVIDEWTSSKESHVLSLVDGEYILTETAAPEGYYCVTTEMHFEVKDEEVTLITATVDNGGEIEVMAGNTIVLKDAPKVQEEYEPPKKDDGGKKKDTPSTTVTTVHTGDDSNVGLWAIMLMISVSVLGAAGIRRRRNAR